VAGDDRGMQGYERSIFWNSVTDCSEAAAARPAAVFRARSTRDHSAWEAREYFIPDFSDWKDHDEYQKALRRLKGDLKAGDEGKTRN